MTADNLKDLGFSTEVIEAIQSVTRKKDEDFESSPLPEKDVMKQKPKLICECDIVKHIAPAY